MKKLIFGLLACCLTFTTNAADIRLKDLGRVEQTRDQSLIGYGLVIGLSGTGDSSRSRVTMQSLKNALRRFGVDVSDRDINSRNVAAVLVTTNLSAYSEVGMKFDVSVSSIGDAKSLAGGQLMITPIKGVDEKIYGFAQGAVTTGGYEVSSLQSSYRKNHTTSGRVVLGGILERPLGSGLVSGDNVNIFLNEPDFTTAIRLVDAISRSRLSPQVYSPHPGKVIATVPEGRSSVRFIAQLESLRIQPDVVSRVVVNEKTGTVVSGGEVILGGVSISHGNLRIDIDTQFSVSQPTGLIGVRGASGIESLVVPNTTIDVDEETGNVLSIPDGANVSDLVKSLNELGVSTRDVITILQSIKSAGALHAELIIN